MIGDFGAIVALAYNWWTSSGGGAVPVPISGGWRGSRGSRCLPYIGREVVEFAFGIRYTGKHLLHGELFFLLIDASMIIENILERRWVQGLRLVRSRLRWMRY